MNEMWRVNGNFCVSYVSPEKKSQKPHKCLKMAQIYQVKNQKSILLKIKLFDLDNTFILHL